MAPFLYAAPILRKGLATDVGTLHRSPLVRSLRNAIEIRRFSMQDLIMLFFTAAFFVVAFLYVKACQKLR